MFKERFFPFVNAPRKTTLPAIQEPTRKSLTKVFKVNALGLGFDTGLSSYFVQDKRRANFEESPYDFDKIVQAVDTDSYVKQGFLKYKELCWKEGWEIVGENPDAVNYLWQRIDLFEIVMGRSFQEFLTQVSDNLFKFHNVFIVKARGDIRPYFPGKLYPPEGKDPIAGFYLIPTEQVAILRDKNNRALAYKQILDPSTTLADNTQAPIWKAEDVIHLYIDRKEGRPFGTPFIISALDDVVALRQIEEDIQNLIHQQLFPLYKYKVGTDDRPATEDEIADAYEELNNLRTDGGLILPERHDVEVIGSQGKALDIANELQHFKNRVATGMGLSPHHLGMSDGGNRAASDRLDIALYDKIKEYQRYLENAIRLHLFWPLLIEGGFDPWVNPNDKKTVSDRCFFRFHEIDTDTQVKKQTHEVNKFAQNVQTWDETRYKLGLPPDANPDNLLMSMQHKLTMQQLEESAKINAALTPPTPASKTVTKSPTGAVSTKTTQPVKPDAAKPSTGVKPNQPNTTRGLGNLMRPSNQFGRRTSPNIRHSDDFFVENLDDLVSLIEDEENDQGEIS